MTPIPNDQLWTEFQPLWTLLRATGGGLLVAGGYGLFLKQHRLTIDRAIPTIVPLERWGDQAPRVTKDLDLVVGLDLIASQAAQRQMTAALSRRGFTVVDAHPRWQFEKTLGADKRMVVDLHADLPLVPTPNLSLDKVRVKHKPSLGEAGIHGRQNAEAAGSEHQPFRFEIDGTEISVPNPVTWTVMKLVAMSDQWRRSEEEARERRSRDYHREQAIKHAHDVCRIVAMTTRDEGQHVSDVVAAIRERSCYVDASKINAVYFNNQDGRAAQVVRRAWRDDDFQQIRRTLADWFR